ncbi:MAG: nicotinamide mononucleotide transporter [Bacteroidales bacterium]|nr:nicotinamide mononucleotide transporter [Bacteroidales bacterium]
MAAALRINDKKFNFWFNMFILVGMITAVVVVNILKIRAQDAITVKQIVVAVGAIMGVVNTVLSANGNIWTFLFGVIDVGIGAYANYDSGNMGQFAQHAFYFLPMQFIGYWQWRKLGAGRRIVHNEASEDEAVSSSVTEEVSTVMVESSNTNADAANVKPESSKVKTEISKVKARRLTGRQWIYVGIAIILGTALCYGILYWIDLKQLQAGKIAEIDRAKLFLDSFVLVLNFAGQILMSYAYADQWYLWNLVNIFSIMLWTNRLMSAGSDSYTIVMVIKYGFYLLNSLNGLRIWLRLSRPQSAS